MDGVLVRGSEPIPGANKFIATLTEGKFNYLVFTNNPLYTPKELAQRLQNIGINVPAERIFTSSMATACFLQSQHPNGKAFVVGESGLTQALYEIGYIITDTDPDYVVLGETFAYSIDQLTKAIRLISKGALFVATNPDNVGMENEGLVPACGALAALLERATGCSPFYVGKPNPLMMRFALNYLGIHSANTVMVGDRLDTDVIAGMMSGMDTILVLSGVSKREDIKKYPYRPTYVVNSVADIDLTA
ncbi:MAG: HAD family hydrolase [Gammaproteobacteria bacterium]|nr:HAD family hydrolase [Gammaproteobacteria bacterium]